MSKRFTDLTAPQPSLGALFRLLTAKRTPWPKNVPVKPRNPLAPAHADQTIVTFIGHSSFLIQTGEGNLLFDPVYAQRAGPFNLLGPRRVRQPGVRFDDLPPISTVLLSHNHYDHCDLDALRRIEARDHPHFVTPLGNAPLIGAKNVTALGWWQTAGDITVTPAKHFSARTPWDRNRALWGGFVIQTRNLRIFYAGDTAYDRHFREIHERCGPFDLAFLPIGAYEPRWFMKDIHMNPAEALQAHADLKPSLSIAMHFGTFQLTTEGIDEPVEQLGERDDFRVLEVGEPLSFPA